MVFPGPLGHKVGIDRFQLRKATIDHLLGRWNAEIASSLASTMNGLASVT
jgi:hypothetical protein